MEGGVSELDLNGSTPGIKLGKGDGHAGQGYPGSQIGIGVINNEVDLFNLRDRDMHFGG